ncbi:hypothetical protein CYLTODRAFT_485833 [Cylindrobasidium torrendii FP15055 ss-10]|uniref:Uncharacterized protein n=1 Tax=Cylindrobasidium torrendii FP15055 ss-10 TaxID=1314674 RepID=A0A0D7BS82_9AGAR|nr:hypothetical protein CYLTODRAFT_485833 [Cylindrobasidium torrendii FP15055 ss-10]
MRYRGQTNILPHGVQKMSVHKPQALKRKTAHEEPPNGWKKYIHPEGLPYFHNPQHRILVQRSLTIETANKLETDFLSIVNDIFKESLPDGDYDFVVDHDSEDVNESTNPGNGSESPSKKDIYRVYVADHENHSIFWLHLEDHFETKDVDTYGIFRNLDTTEEMIEVYYEHLYWKHIEFFPDVHRLRDVDWDILDLALQNLEADVLLSSTSTSAFELSEIQRMEQLSSVGRRGNNGYPYGRFMNKIWADRIMNYYGQSFARLNSTDSVYPASSKESTVSWLFEMAKILLFYAPVTHLEMLEKSWTDGITSIAVWKKLVKRLDREWETYNLLSTIFLNANIAFLTIASVDDTRKGDRGVEKTGIMITFSYLSTLALLAAIILSLLLQRFHRDKKDGDLDSVHGFLKDAYKTSGNTFNALAVLYSLPYALLLWSVAFFLIGFLAMCFLTPIWWTKGLMIGGILFIVLLVGWSIHRVWMVTSWCYHISKALSTAIFRSNPHPNRQVNANDPVPPPVTEKTPPLPSNVASASLNTVVGPTVEEGDTQPLAASQADRAASKGPLGSNRDASQNV